MERKLVVAWAVLTVLLLAVLGACQAQQPTPTPTPVPSPTPQEAVSPPKVDPNLKDPVKLIEAGNCGGCHTIPGVAGANGITGPNWCEPAEEVEEGEIRKEDIVAMIVAPQAEVEEGFLNVMPPVYGQMYTPEQVNILVDFIANLDCEGVTVEEPEPITPEDKDPKVLMRKAGCVGCHTIPGVEGAVGTIGPTMCEPAEEFQKGEITKDEIIEFIVDPGAEVTEGYPDIMPRVFKDVFTQEQLQILADFIANLECE